ncbi:MAG: uracil phosphoribosyltransferase [Thermoproteota archaeon]|jgi:uracil phosphoribosyltransferase
MTLDCQYQNFSFESSEIKHEYGDKVVILSNPYLLSLMAKAGHSSTKQPLMNHLVTQMYQMMFQDVVNKMLPVSNQSIETRMKEFTDKGVFQGPVFETDTPVVCVDLARAGTLPCHLYYENFNYFINPDKVRQDHFYVNRETNDAGEVIGVNVSGSKIGGPVDDAIIILPDPMGATGSTIVNVYDHYSKNLEGTPKAFAAIHLVITPEYIERVTKDCPNLTIFALRLDRGTSSDEALNSIPGSNKDEKGLNNIQYIVPGAGGVGEVLNNSYV